MLSRAGSDGSAVGVFERRMRGPAGAAIELGIETFQQNDLITLHVGEIRPSLVRVVSEVQDPADAVAEVTLCRDEVVLADAIPWADSNRVGFYRTGERPPYVDRREPAAELVFGFCRRQQVLNALWGGIIGKVVMGAAYGSRTPSFSRFFASPTRIV